MKKVLLIVCVSLLGSMAYASTTDVDIGQDLSDNLQSVEVQAVEMAVMNNMMKSSEIKIKSMEPVVPDISSIIMMNIAVESHNGMDGERLMTENAVLQKKRLTPDKVPLPTNITLVNTGNINDIAAIQTDISTDLHIDPGSTCTEFASDITGVRIGG